MAVVGLTQESVLNLWEQQRAHRIPQVDSMCQGPDSIWCCAVCSSISWIFRHKQSILIDGVEYMVTTRNGGHRASHGNPGRLELDPVTTDAVLAAELAAHRSISKVLVSTWCRQSHQVRERPGRSLTELARGLHGLTVDLFEGIVLQLVVALHALHTQHQFNQHSVVLEDLMFYQIPVAFKYLERKVVCPWTLKFSSLSCASITTADGTYIGPDSPLTPPYPTPLPSYWYMLCYAGLRDLMMESQLLVNIDRVIQEHDHNPQLLDLVLEILPRVDVTDGQKN